MRKVTGFVLKVLVSAWLAGVVSSCGGGLATLTYSVGGTISGISSGSVVLQNNGGNDLTVSSDGRFTFTGRLPAGSAYLVTVASAPSGVTCTPSNASGTVGTANVTNVSVVCSGSTSTVDLSVTHSGIGAGTVTSDVGDINCTKTGGTCTSAYDEGATVVLTATADSGYIFSGWNGSGCTGAGTCTVTVSSTKTVRATFIMVAFDSARAVNGSDAANTNTTRNIWVMKTDGTGQSALTQTTAMLAFSDTPDWSPDGSQLVFESMLNLDGSPTGAANTGVFNIWMINADGTGLTALTQLTDMLANSGSPRWSPDGTKIAFSSQRNLDGTDSGNTASNIWIINADGTGLTALTQTTAMGADSFSPEWSPDGSQLVFESRLNLDGGVASAANAVSNIWVINADGTGGLTALTQLTAMFSDSGIPQWSPDSGKIAFHSSRKLDGTDAANDNNVTNVWVINADGTGGLVALTQGTAMMAFSFSPIWSPDGSKLVFESWLDLDGDLLLANNTSNVWVVNADGTGLTALTSLAVVGTDSTAPQWFPDGSKILFSSSRDASGTANAGVSNVWLLDVNTLGVSNLTQTTAVGADAADAIASH